MFFTVSREPRRSRCTSTSRAASSPPSASEECTRSTTCTASSPSSRSHDEELLVYRILDGLTDAYYPVIDGLENQIDAARGRRARRPRSEHLDAHLPPQAERARAAPARRRPARPVPRRPRLILALEGFAKGSKPYLRDIIDHLQQIAGEFQRQTDDLISLTQTYFNANADRLNAVATRLTIGGTLFIVWTFITGFFGQNFGWLVDNVESKRRLPAVRRRRAH